MASPEPEKEWIRPEGKTSFVWDHFKINKTGSLVKCDHCLHKTFKYNASTTNYSRHLANKHSIFPDKNPAEDQPKIDDIFNRYHFEIDFSAQNIFLTKIL